MLKKIYLPLIALSLLALDITAQSEKIIEKGKHAIPFASDIIGNRLFFCANERTAIPFGEKINTTLYVTDLHLNVIDSLDINQEFGLTKSMTTGVKAYGDSVVAVSVMDGSLNPFPHNNLILFVDSNLTVLDTVQVRAVVDTFMVTHTLNIIDSLLVVANHTQAITDTKDYPNMGIYNLYNRELISSSNYKHITGTAFNNITYFNNKYVCTLSWYLSPYPFVTLNSDFTYDTAYYKLDFNPAIFYRIDNFLHSGSDYLYTAGLLFGDFAGLVKFDQNFEIVQMDTIYIPNRIVEQRGCIDYQSLDNIFIGVGEGNNIEGSPYINIFNADTAGNFHWHKRIFQDSSVRFVLEEVVAAPDGGAFLISRKYDPRYKQEKHHRISIIKIGPNGEIVAEREFQTSPEFALYPNPASDHVEIEGLPHQKELTATFYSTAGRQVWKGHIGRERIVDVSHLATGTYLLELRDEEGNAETTKLVIE